MIDSNNPKAAKSEALFLRLGTRGSLLARTQSQLVADELERVHPALKVELIIFKTSGDLVTERPLHEIGGKGLFTKELEQALLDGKIDFAVHSYKDVPTTMPLVDESELVIAAVPRREDARDLLASEGALEISQLPAGATVGTGSLRRQCQLLAVRPDLQIKPIRGNIDTRLRKLREKQFDAVVLAMAGVRRAALFDASIMQPVDPAILLPAAGQGALALQCRRGDARTAQLLGALNDATTAACITAERALISLLAGDCMSPIGAYAVEQGDQIFLRASVAGRGGTLPMVKAEARGATPQAVSQQVFGLLDQQGIMRRLHDPV